jgi:hypothetical protein
MKKLLYVIAFLFVVGVLAGPKDSNTSARLASNASAQTYGGASQVSSAITLTGAFRLAWLLPRIFRLTGSRAIRAGKCVKKWTVVGKLERELISTQPNSDGCKLDERQIVCREFVVSGRDPPTLLDLVEGPFDQIARAVQIRLKRHARPTYRSSALPRLTGGQRLHYRVPDASSSPAHEAIVASRVWPIILRQVAPRCT